MRSKPRWTVTLPGPREPSHPGPGGWAATLEYCGVRKDFSDGALATTNNRMELQAAIEAFLKLKEPCEVELYTDSEYLRDGITNRIHGWKARAWKKKIKNRNLWLQLDDVCKKQRVTWHWVRAHSGTLENERCDMLAVEAAQKIKATHSIEQRDEALNESLKRRVADDSGGSICAAFPLHHNPLTMHGSSH